MDASPNLPHQSRVPVFNMPGVVTATIAVLVGIHALRAVLPEEMDWQAIIDFAFIPARWTASFDPGRVAEIIQAAAEAAAGTDAAETRREFARAIIAQDATQPWTFLTYGLLHGSWLHVSLNAVWLAAFGTPVARRYGIWRFLAIGLIGVAAGALLHLVLDPLSVMPLIGASAGISALMGAAVRFVFVPPPTPTNAMAWQIPERPPLPSLAALLQNRTAVIFLVIWIVTNLLFGLLAEPLGAGDGPVAWDAHLGGFFAGFLLLPLFETRNPATA